MTKLQDQDYLLNHQYHNPDNLNARINLHSNFSTNDYGWFRWVFDHFQLADECRILELGCGPIDLWLENLHRIQPGWEITLSDFSPGMVAKARSNLAKIQHPFQFEIIDAQAIPYENHRFDVVIANHCVYHFPNIANAFSEISRVLTPGGVFYSSTIGKGHLRGIRDLVSRYSEKVENVFEYEENPFMLESGTAQLSKWFTDVQTYRYPDSLLVTESDPLVDFILSTARFGMEGTQRSDLASFIRAEIVSAGGSIKIQKESGLFVSYS